MIIVTGPTEIPGSVYHKLTWTQEGPSYHPQTAVSTYASRELWKMTTASPVPPTGWQRQGATGANHVWTSAHWHKIATPDCSKIFQAPRILTCRSCQHLAEFRTILRRWRSGALLALPTLFFLFNYCIFTIYSIYLKKVISKRDGCEQCGANTSVSKLSVSLPPPQQPACPLRDVTAPHHQTTSDGSQEDALHECSDLVQMATVVGLATTIHNIIF
jgi:hypothetical protein